jgi:hypothetical protein
VLLLACLAPSEGRASAADARQALDAVSQSIQQLRAGNVAAARQALAGVEQIIARESAAIAAFEERAKDSFARCVASVGELDRMIGDITVTEQRVAAELATTEGSLANAVQDAEVSSHEMDAIQASIAQLRAAVEARQAKLRELEKWWWVPGYGAYLGIRTLADHDVTELEAAIRELNDHRVQNARSEAALRAAQGAITRLSAERSRLRAERETAAGMHAVLNYRMQSVRDVTVFVQQAKQFWGEVGTFVGYQVQGAVGSTTALADLLNATMGEKGSDALVLGIGSEQENLRAKLVEFAAKLEGGSAFANLTAADCAPSAGLTEATAKLAACHFMPTWPHYEITNLETCTFRYVSPPGCPPASVSAAPPGNRFLDGMTRDMQNFWRGRVAAEQNWIGRARCTSNATLFLGRHATARACEATCTGRIDCHFWTYNVNNGAIANTDGECWGGTASLQPEIGRWEGFVSGGLKCALVPSDAKDLQCQ